MRKASYRKVNYLTLVFWEIELVEAQTLKLTIELVGRLENYEVIDVVPHHLQFAGQECILAVILEEFNDSLLSNFKGIGFEVYKGGVSDIASLEGDLSQKKDD